MHLVRLSRMLEARGLRIRVHNESKVRGEAPDFVTPHLSYGLQFVLQLFRRQGILHSHTSNWLFRAMLGLYSLCGQTVVQSLHGRENLIRLKRGNPLVRVLVVWSFNRAAKLVLVGEHIRPLMREMGISTERAEVIPAFIPPSPEELGSGVLPSAVRDFRERHRRILAANGSIVLWPGGEDLYGIRDLVLAMERVIRRHPDTGLVIYLARTNEMGEAEKAYLGNVEREVTESPAARNILLHFSRGDSFIPLLQQAELALRPTRSDGADLTTLEAFSVGCPVLASDCIPRQPGCEIHRTGDVEHLAERIAWCLDHRKELVADMPTAELREPAARMLQLYGRLLGRDLQGPPE